MKLLLARHAETNYNVLGLCNADPTVDVHLSDKGLEQAEQLAEALKDVDYEVGYISELPRTRQTAEIINKYHQKPLIVDARLNDNKTGFEGRPIGEWQAAVQASEDRLLARFNDGESLQSAADRAVDFIESLKTRDHLVVLLVAHGFITKAIYAHLTAKTLAEASTYDLVQGTYAEFEI